MTLFVSALEPSSNLHFKYLFNELKKLCEVKLIGVFSRDICEDTPLFLPEDFSQMGFIDVIKKLGFFLSAQKKMQELALNADKILLMDSSSFNLPLAKKIKKIDSNKEIMYYILPQIWAWKPWRAKDLERYCDKLAAILPFEVEFYKKKARFVGHPLLDELENLDSEFKKDSNIISFMPGSRMSEINRIFPIFREVKNELKKEDSDLRFNLIAPRHFKDKDLSEIYGNLDDFNVEFSAQESLKNSKFAFICSGTATLECALIGTPFVLGYKAKKLDELIVRCFLHIKLVGIANILYQKIESGELFHQELLQDDLSVKNLLDSYKCANSEDFARKSKKLRTYLKTPSAKNVALWLAQ